MTRPRIFTTLFWHLVAALSSGVIVMIFIVYLESVRG